MSDPNRPGPRVPTATPDDQARYRRPLEGAEPTSSTTSGSLPPAETVSRSARVTVARRGPRRARLVVKHIDPWTVMKVTFIVSLVILVVLVIATAIIYAVLGQMGVWDQINDLVNQVTPTTASQSLHNPLTGSRIIGVAAIVGAINVVLLTALATLAAAIYNLISDLVGGIEVTLTDP
ncbi:MAG TPA: DUF3566 domain-containing protein [Acidothermaceae bacterium]|nr:DUF3566 domain-containing protein [Acidothermaceae bacterium]